jgi:tetratricopeptide (TPR) repeat protein
MFKNHASMRILIPWSIAFLLLSLYYYYIQFPMERFFIKGVDYIRENKDYQAMEEFHKVLRIYPAYEPVYFNLAYMYQNNGLLKEATAYYKHANMISNLNSVNLTERGTVYYSRYSVKKRYTFFNEHVIQGYLLTLPNSRD